MLGIIGIMLFYYGTLFIDTEKTKPGQANGGIKEIPTSTTRAINNMVYGQGRQATQTKNIENNQLVTLTLFEFTEEATITPTKIEYVIVPWISKTPTSKPTKTTYYNPGSGSYNTITPENTPTKKPTKTQTATPEPTATPQPTETPEPTAYIEPIFTIEPISGISTELPQIIRHLRWYYLPILLK